MSSIAKTPNPSSEGICAIKPRSAGQLYVEAVENPVFAAQVDAKKARKISRLVHFAIERLSLPYRQHRLFESSRF